MKAVQEFFAANPTAGECWVVLGCAFASKEKAETFAAGTHIRPEKYTPTGRTNAPDQALLDTIDDLNKKNAALAKEVEDLKTAIVNNVQDKAVKKNLAEYAARLSAADKAANDEALQKLKEEHAAALKEKEDTINTLNAMLESLKPDEEKKPEKTNS